MYLLPAIDILDGKAVRLAKGDYAKVTVYNENPVEQAKVFEDAGAEWLHMVDLDGAKSGNADNIRVVEEILSKTSLKVEIGGGIRSMDVIEKYLSAGIDRVILGTAAVTDEVFLKQAVSVYGEKIAVGIDIKDGYVAIKGWTEKSQEKAMDFCEKMRDLGVKTLICTDISKDGAMQGTNHGLYEELSRKLDLKIIASGGVSSLEDVTRLAKMDIHGAIIGKAYYTGAVDLKQAIEVAK